MNDYGNIANDNASGKRNHSYKLIFLAFSVNLSKFCINNDIAGLDYFPNLSKRPNQSMSVVVDSSKLPKLNLDPKSRNALKDSSDSSGKQIN